MTKSKVSPARRIHSDEIACGVRAAYHVYYWRGSKLLFDPVFDVNTEQVAIERVRAFAKEAGDTIVISHAVRLVPSSGLR